MNTRQFATLAYFAVACLTVPAMLHAQSVELIINRDTGIIELSNPDTANALNFDYYRISSAAGVFSLGAISADAGGVDAANWNSLQNQDDPALSSTTSWRELGNTSTNPPSRFAFGEVRQEGTTELSNGSNLALGQIYDVAQAHADAGFLVDVQDVTIEYGIPSAFGGTTLAGTVTYQGNRQQNNLVLNIFSDGTAEIENESQTTVNLIGYTIASSADGGGLDSGFAGIRGSEIGWDDANSSADFLSETNQTGALEISPGATVSLGQITSSGLTAADLDFDFAITNAGFAGSTINGVEEDIAVQLGGDFDMDDDVDGNDFLVWQRGFGAVFDGNDLDAWQSSYGNSTLQAVAGVVAVPEPGTAMLLLLSTLALAVHRRQS